MKCLLKNITLWFTVFFISMIFADLGQTAFAAVDNSGAGVLNVRSQAPIQNLRMVMPLVSAGSVKPGWGFWAAAAWTNVWAEEQEYYLDYEMLDGRVAVNYGFNEKIAVSLEYDNRSYFGGHLDGFIQGSHNAVGLSQNGRDSVSNNLSRVGRVGDTVEERKADIFNNNGISLTLSYELMKGDEIWPAVNLSTSVRYGLETGQVFSDNHPVDYGFSLGFGKRLFEKWYSHLIFSYTFYDFDQGWEEPGFEPIRLEDQQLGGLLSFGYEYSERLTILFEYMIYEAAVKDIRGLDKTIYEVHLGFKYRTENYGTVEFGLIENNGNFDNSPDFGIHLGWGYTFN